MDPYFKNDYINMGYHMKMDIKNEKQLAGKMWFCKEGCPRPSVHLVA